MTSMRQLLLKNVWLIIFGAICLSWLLINPTGNYALNDDWTFAHFAKHTAESGRFTMDAASSPTAVGQAWIGALIIRAFGFHYFTLRLATLCLMGIGLWSIDFTLKRATVTTSLRVFALACFAFNPIVYYSTASFMTELWGWLPPLVGVALWHFDARKHDGTSQLTSHWIPPVVGLVIGLGFFTRQFAVLLFPALVAAECVAGGIGGRWRRVWRSMPAVIAGGAVLAATVWVYFWWAKATGNFRPEFAERIDHLTVFDSNVWIMQSGAAVMYLTAFCLPWLICFRWKHQSRWSWDLSAVLLLLLLFAAQHRFREQALTDFWIGPTWMHKVFPYVVNVIWNAGLGPITLDDVFSGNAAKPSWPKVFWTTLESLLMVAAVLWIAVGANVVERLKRKRESNRLSVTLFGALLMLGSLVAIIQTHQNEMVDRYYLPLVLGAAFLFPCVFDNATTAQVDFSMYRKGLAGFCFAALTAFSVLGAHDAFRWNDARWRLIGKAMSLGGTEGTIQAGYEANCWWRQEEAKARLSCEGGCQCIYGGFCCVDDRFRIGMSVNPGYTVVESIQPNYWLASGPPVILGQRR
jgi:hypothetical protein